MGNSWYCSVCAGSTRSQKWETPGTILFALALQEVKNGKQLLLFSFRCLYKKSRFARDNKETQYGLLILANLYTTFLQPGDFWKKLSLQLEQKTQISTLDCF